MPAAPANLFVVVEFVSMDYQFFSPLVWEFRVVRMVNVAGVLCSVPTPKGACSREQRQDGEDGPEAH